MSLFSPYLQVPLQTPLKLCLHLSWLVASRILCPYVLCPSSVCNNTLCANPWTPLLPSGRAADPVSEVASMLAQLYAQRERQATAARQEAVARSDLEAMVLRIERHFKVSNNN